MSNDVRSVASSVATTTSEALELDPATIIMLLELVLPAIMNLPCFSGKTPEEMRESVTKSPNMMRIMAASMIRNRSKTPLTKKKAFILADALLERLVSSSDNEIKEFTLSIGK